MAGLNVELFRKVVCLARSQPHTDSDHAQRERDTAWAKADDIARAAGLGLEDALSILDEADRAEGLGLKHRRVDPGFWEWMAQSVARGRKQKAGRKRAAARRRAQAGQQAWCDHPLEVILRKALKGHDVAERALEQEEIDPAALDAIRNAIRWPSTMREAVTEEALWNEVEARRRGDEPRYRLEDGPFLRRALLREYLEGSAKTPDDMLARADWLLTRHEREMVSQAEQADWFASVVGDLGRVIAMLREAQAVSSPPGHRASTAGAAPPNTNREKRERVRAILAEPGGDALSIRELARRAGVSVQGAANIKAAFKQSA